MANTYTQLLIQLVFAVKGRQSLIQENHRVAVEKYICGIIQQQQCKPLAIYCNPDHCHILIGLHPDVSVATIARLVKNNSSKWINNNHLTTKQFAWQKGYGAFTYARSQLEVVTRYIINQPIHHGKKTFQEEYHEFLEKFEVDYQEDYVFDFLDN